VSPAQAAGGSSIALNQIRNSSGTYPPSQATPHYGDTVYFTISTNESQPYVNLQCTQSGALVYAKTDAYWGTNDRSFTLAYDPFNGFGWTGGAATCTAALWKLGNGSKMLASTTFNVLA